MINKVILLGYIGSDPEINYMSNGKSIAKINIATNVIWKNKNGEKETRTEWHRVVIFGNNISEYLNKGSQVYIEGYLRTRKWEGEDNKEHYITEIIVDIRGTIKLLKNKLSNKSESENSKNFISSKKESYKTLNKLSSNNTSEKNLVVENFDDDIPF